MNEKLKITLKGSVNILPLLIPVVPFGIILGAIGIELGFSVLETFATSFVIFGGASQIVFLQLLSGGASQIIAVSSAFVVNSRHFLYGATFSEYLNKLPMGWKIILSYLLTDQAFAVSNTSSMFEFNRFLTIHVLPLKVKGVEVTLKLTSSVSAIFCGYLNV